MMMMMMMASSFYLKHSQMAGVEWSLLKQHIYVHAVNEMTSNWLSLSYDLKLNI